MSEIIPLHESIKPQNEIILNWVYKTSPLVSVICTTYNHELYIERAILSFLQQKTNFAYEIIIHDDASTDNTLEIVKKYQKSYPNIIKIVAQEVNQYSRGTFKPIPFACTYSQAQYVAICEGDDYWINSDKLQIQLNLMQQYPNCDISFHPAKINNSSGAIISFISSKIQVIGIEDVIEKGGDFCPTASLMVRTSCLVNLPEWFFQFAPVGDHYIQMLASLDGGILYFPEPFSVYSMNVDNSWTNSAKKMSLEVRISNSLRLYSQEKRALDCFNKETFHKYEKSTIIYLSNRIMHLMFLSLISLNLKLLKQLATHLKKNNLGTNLKVVFNEICFISRKLYKKGQLLWFKLTAEF